MRQRLGIGLYALLCFPPAALAQEPEPPPDQSRVATTSTRSAERGSAVPRSVQAARPYESGANQWLTESKCGERGSERSRVEPLAQPSSQSDERLTTSPHATLSGHLDLHYVHRDGAIEEARGSLNGSPGSFDSASGMAADAWVRLDFELDERIRAVLQLDRLPYDSGDNLALGDDAVEPVLGQGYLEIKGFLEDKLTLRFGQFDFSYRLRPHGEPFFFDSDAESFWSGSNGTFVRTTAERDRTASGGVRLQYDVAEIALAEFALVFRNEPLPASPSQDDLTALLYLNALAGERTALFLLGALDAGPGREADVWTVGAGANQYFGPLRVIEIFAEAYGQFGHVGPDADKRAWALQAGARLASESGLWGEAALVYRSGDRRPTDGRDQAFQSAERVDRFLIVESAEFGMDWDTNVRALQFGAGAPLGRGLSARADAGWFAFNTDLRTPAGGILLSDSDDTIGFEVDGTLLYERNAQVRLTLRGGMLLGSDVLETLSAEGTDHSWVVVGGMSAGF